MDDIRRRDLTLFARELFSPARIVLVLFGIGMTTLFSAPWSPFPVGFVVFGWLVTLGLVSYTAWNKSVAKRFKAQRFKILWEACCDRLDRFESGLKTLSRRGVADLQELPRTIQGVSRDLYRALRRADIVATEVSSSEGWLVAQPRMGQPMSPDRQAQELYRIADKNIAEYRQHYIGVMAGVERTEAQAAVFTTTLDTLRMKMLSYRLVGKETESPTQDFLAALTEARMQLESIDKALDELELTPFPKTISIIPEPAGSESVNDDSLAFDGAAVPPPVAGHAPPEDVHIELGNPPEGGER